MRVAVRFAVVIAAGLSVFGTPASAQYRGLQAQMCAVIDCSPANPNTRANVAAEEARRRALTAARAAELERRNDAAQADQRGLDAAARGDWQAAANAYIDALKDAPDDQTIRTHLDRANLGLADTANATQTGELRRRIADALNAADIEGMRRRLHVEELQLAIPAACFVAEQLESGAACDVIDPVSLGWNLAGANEHREMLHILREEFAEKIVFMSFPEDMGIGTRVGLVQEMYTVEAREFEALVSRIRSAMSNEQKAAKLRTKFAIADSAGVSVLRRRVADETRRSADTLMRYVRNHPEGPGVAFHCELACRQLIAAARGADVFN